MKSLKISILTSLLIVSTGVFSSFKKGDCATASMSSAAIDRLKKFTMVEEFPFYIKSAKKGETLVKKQVVTLNRGVRYKFFTIRNTDYEGLPILSIYNNEKQEALLGSTYNPTAQKFYNDLEFECKATGNYCITFSFLDGMEGCAIGVFASLVTK